MIKAIALDDEPPALEIIAAFCKRIDIISLERTFTKTGDAFRYLEKFPVDLLLLDINMPSSTGIDFYRSIPQQAMVIFTTSYSEYAVESYNVNAIDYLLKPFTFKRFEQAIHKAYTQYRYQQAGKTAAAQHLVLRVDYSLVKIALQDILFIEGLDNYMKIHIAGQTPVVARLTMKALLEKLPANEFLRVHRSYIVPFRRIEHVRNRIITVSGTEIPLGSSYEAEFFRHFHQ
jgi:DNA-binding LytR/AlgR family response regulator